MKRVLLKLSGELLKGAESAGISHAAAVRVAERVNECVAAGVETALVVGAGNLFRGEAASEAGMDRCCADSVGMLATMMNALTLRHALESLGLRAEVQSAFPVSGVVDGFDGRRARRLLSSGTVVLFAAGTGHPFFTTDTTAALRACQIEADAILKGTKVDGVYSADPVEHPDAIRYSHISFRDVLQKRLRVMDSTAFSMCMDNRMPIIVFKFGTEGELSRILQGDLRLATLVDADDSPLRKVSNP